MNVLGHAGLTLGVVYTSGYIIDAAEALIQRRGHRGRLNPREKGGGLLRYFLDGPRSLERFRIDFRILFLGSLLPDIIDKPLGFWLLPELVNYNVRSIGHSLTFNLALLTIAFLILAMSRFSGLRVLALGSLGHAMLDQMWQLPERFLWPLFGWQFPRGTTSFEEWAAFHLSFAWLDGPEVVGALFLLWFALQLRRPRAMAQFLKWGTVGESRPDSVAMERRRPG